MPRKFLDIFKPRAAKDSESSEAKIESARLLDTQGRVAEAKAICEEILVQQPDHWESFSLLAELEARQERPEKAIQLYSGLIDLRPDFAPAYYKLGNLYRKRGQLELALENYDRAIELDSHFANAFCNRGVVLGLLLRFEDALGSYERAIALNPLDALALYNRGDVLRELKRFKESLVSYDQAIALVPNYAEAYCNRGVLLQELKDSEAALISYNRSVEINSGLGFTYLNRGNLYREKKKMDMALADYDRAIEVDPANASAHCNRGVVLTELRQWGAAFASLNRAIEINSNHAEAHGNLGLLLAQVRQLDAAISSLDKAIALKPDYAEALRNRGDALVGLKQYAAALENYDQAIVLQPDIPYLRGDRRHKALYICDWSNLERDVNGLAEGIDADEKVAPPFTVLGLLNSARLQHRAARAWVRDQYPAENTFPEIRPYTAGKKIRLGYFSGDFRDHPVALLASEFLESHDRSRYEVTAFSFGPGTQDDVRKRLERAFDRFVDARDISDEDIVLTARNLNIDIAVDLTGHTAYSRTRVFAMRAAPIQVSYLGYAGTTGADYMDYLIGDRVVIPQEQRHNYTEKIAYLPNSFLPHDSSRTIATNTFTREDLGLPRAGFVFCCFNNNYKITPHTFDSWMRILTRVENSVLWLSQNEPTAASNLRQEALRQGVDGGRLIFADRVSSIAAHLARQRAADLFLDTLPYNAHATALDALWAGLPVLTCVGEGFASRVAASLLSAIGMPELITTTMTQYENVAVHLAANPQHLVEIKQKLALNRLKAPLFDTKAFTRHVEAAYASMYERSRMNLPPQDIYIDG
jgi:protein O-GlcNAc transferase